MLNIKLIEDEILKASFMKITVTELLFIFKLHYKHMLKIKQILSITKDCFIEYNKSILIPNKQNIVTKCICRSAMCPMCKNVKYFNKFVRIKPDNFNELYEFVKNKPDFKCIFPYRYDQVKHNLSKIYNTLPFKVNSYALKKSRIYELIHIEHKYIDDIINMTQMYKKDKCVFKKYYKSILHPRRQGQQVKND